MTDPAAKSELMQSLGRLVRGLSCLFWGLPLTLVIYVQTARMDWLDALGTVATVPAAGLTALLLYGLTLMAGFQNQERVWINSIERARLVGLVCLGLSPFLHWWHRLPFVTLYAVSVILLVLFGLLFLLQLNRVLLRLTAILPDEMLRHETQFFVGFNRAILSIMPLLPGVWMAVSQIKVLPQQAINLLRVADEIGLWFMLFLLLIPVATTMALIWKIKEAIFAGVFDTQR